MLGLLFVLFVLFVVWNIKVRLLFLVLTRRAQQPTDAAGHGETNMDAQKPASGIPTTGIRYS